METIEATYAELHRMLDEIEPLLLRFWDAKGLAFASLHAEASRQAAALNVLEEDAEDVLIAATPGVKTLYRRLGDMGITDHPSA